MHAMTCPQALSDFVPVWGRRSPYQGSRSHSPWVLPRIEHVLQPELTLDAGSETRLGPFDRPRKKTMWIALTLLLLPGSSSAQDASDPYKFLAEQSRDNYVTRVVQAVTPSVVTIDTEITRNGYRGPFVSRGGGTGVVIHENGYVVTNYHVVKDARRILVSFAGDPIPLEADLLSFKREADLALLLIRQDLPRRNPVQVASTQRQEGQLAPRVRRPGTRRRFQAVRMGTSSDLMSGEAVIAIGNPHGQTHTVSTGIVSGLHRDVRVPAPHNLHFEGLIQTDASINLGNSGGPLLNVRGELIGINTVMNTTAENIGFAIPVDQVIAVLAEELFPNASRSWLGLELADDDRLTVTKVWPDGPASLAGICEGDRLESLGQVALDGHESWILAELQVVPGSKIQLGVARGGQIDQVQLLAWDKLDGLLFQRLGATFKSVHQNDRTYAVVARVAGEGPAADIGLRVDDWIPALRPKLANIRRSLRIQDKTDLASVVGELEPGTILELNVYRDLDRNGSFSPDERLEGELQID
ncbi:MAG: serine protease Do [Planctomycetota bacterium]|jgi:serine protease Do